MRISDWSSDVCSSDLIWRMCQAKDAAIRDWVKLAVTRARNSGMPAVFWLDPYRPHEHELIQKVVKYVQEYDIKGLKIEIMRSEEHTSELQSLMRNSYDVFYLKHKTQIRHMQ